MSIEHAKHRIALFSSKAYDKDVFDPILRQHHIEVLHIEARLEAKTAPLAKGYDTVCAFVNDEVNADVTSLLATGGVKHIALRCAGYNNVDIENCRSQGISVSHVPAYSPEAVAEHAMALVLTLNRRMHKAYNRVKEGNFDLNGLLGFTLHNKVVGVIGTGHIGTAFIKIAKGFGCQILCYDPYPNQLIVDETVQYVELETLFKTSDIISLHCPLSNENKHLIEAESIQQMKDGVMLINTSRGGLINTSDLIKGLKTQKIGYVGLDVYEMESEIFFRDRSCEVIQDDIFQRLSTFHNVLITGHQGFFTKEAITEIAEVTMSNIIGYWQGNVTSDRIL